MGDTNILHNDPEKVIKDWYFSIEYADGKFTPGKNFQSTSLTRRLLKHTEIEGRDCLDMGAMECLVPLLMSRRGARYVAGTDAGDLSRQVDFLRRQLNVWFDYFPHISSDRLLDFFQRKYHHDRYMENIPRDKNTFGFDVVVCSGILYHTLSPLHFLGQARSLVRNGGILIVETAVTLSSAYTMQFNFTGEQYVYSPSDTWMISVPLFDYLLRYLRLQPLSCQYLKQSDSLARMAVACRATHDFHFKPKEEQFKDSLWNLDYESLVDYSLTSRTSDVAFNAPKEWAIMNNETQSCDLMASIIATPPSPPTLDEVRLNLCDMY